MSPSPPLVDRAQFEVGLTEMSRSSIPSSLMLSHSGARKSTICCSDRLGNSLSAVKLKEPSPVLAPYQWYASTARQKASALTLSLVPNWRGALRTVTGGWALTIAEVTMPYVPVSRCQRLDKPIEDVDGHKREERGG
ncbi:hypothetical protein VUR80DRAFT_726 [Thermomyces stellatus]